MNQLFNLILVSLVGLSLGFKLTDEQLQFNDALSDYYKTLQPLTKSSKDTPTENRAHSPQMRRSTERGKLLNDLYSFSHDFANSLKTQKRQTNLVLSNPMSLSDGPGLVINSSYCPYKVQKTCNPSSIYRSFDGSCNNLVNPLYGSAETPYIRLLPPNYQDGVNSIRSFSISGSLLPNPRTVSLTLSQPVIPNKLTREINHLFVFFGQFLTHDMSGTSTVIDANGAQKSCPCGSNDRDCIPISIPASDPYLGFVCPRTPDATNPGPNCPTAASNITCIKVTRSSSTPLLDCTTPYRQTLNLLSAFIDGTAIYGSNEDSSKELRTFSGGLLKTTQGQSGPSRVPGETITSRSYLPYSNEYCSTNWANPTHKCFKAGEHRTSENLALVSVQTLFLREHNRIATQLAKINPKWNDEIIYQETRRILIAVLQHITYNEFVPLISGDQSLSPSKLNEYYNGYNSNINPQLTDEFATAAFRMGHSLVRQQFSRNNINQNGRLQSYDLFNVFFQSDFAYDAATQGLNSIFLGLLSDLAWQFGTYGHQIQNNLFQTKYSNGSTIAQDLFSINIQRGRDHGLPTYIQFLKQYRNININAYRDLSRLMNGQRIQDLQRLYSNVNDIDLYAGGLVESLTTLPNQGEVAVGPSFGAIIMDQFSRIKRGDRYYYENGPSVSPYPFAVAQLAQIKTVTMAGMICRNFDIFKIQTNAFTISSGKNAIIDCSSLSSQLDLSSWSSSM